MNSLEEIRHALGRLNYLERQELLYYLERFGKQLYTVDTVEKPRLAYASPVSEYMTREEFLEFQERSPIPYEYINGIIRQIIGPSVAHCRVTQNLCDAIRTRLRGGSCEAVSSGLQLNLTLGDDEIIYRPDLFVVCEEKGWGKNWIPSPKLVVEVLSPSTQYIDKREKLVNYRRVLSLDEYVVAAQKRVELTIYRRSEDWVPDVVNSLHASVELRSLGFSIPLVEIYERVFSGRSASDSDV